MGAGRRAALTWWPVADGWSTAEDGAKRRPQAVARRRSRRLDLVEPNPAGRPGLLVQRGGSRGGSTLSCHDVGILRR
jgi:hypothetical protein